MTRPLSTYRATFTVLCAVLLFSTAGPYIRMLEGTDPFLIVFWRSTLMVLCVFAYLSFSRRRAWLVSFATAPWQLYVSGALMALVFTCFIFAVHYSDPTTATLIMCVEPLLGALLGWLFLRERLRLTTLLCIVGSMAGLYLILAAGQNSQTPAPSNADNKVLWGNFLALVLSLSYAANVVVLKTVAAQKSIFPSIIWGGVLSAVAAAFFVDPFAIRLRELFWLLLLGTTQLGMGLLLFQSAMRQLSVVQITLIGLAEPLGALVLMWLFFNELPHHYALWGGALVVVMVVINEYIQAKNTTPTAPQS